MKLPFSFPVVAHVAESARSSAATRVPESPPSIFQRVTSARLLSQLEPEPVVIPAPHNRLAGLGHCESLCARFSPSTETAAHGTNGFTRSMWYLKKNGFMQMWPLNAVLEGMHAHIGLLVAQEHGCQALCNFTQGGELEGLVCAIRAAEAGALEAIVAAMVAHPSELRLQQLACNALLGVTGGDDNAEGRSREQRSAEAGAIEAVVSSMETHRVSTVLQERACLCLCSISCGADAGAPARVQRIAMSGALDCIIDAMMVHAESASVQLGGCQALRNIASGADAAGLARARRATELGALEAIGKAMRTHINDVAVQEQACVALYNIMSGTDAVSLAHTSHAAMGGLHDAVIGTMIRHAASDLVHKHGSIILTYIASGANLVSPEALQCPKQDFYPKLPTTSEDNSSIVSKSQAGEAATAVTEEVEPAQEDSALVVETEPATLLPLATQPGPAMLPLSSAIVDVEGMEAVATEKAVAAEKAVTTEEAVATEEAVTTTEADAAYFGEEAVATEEADATYFAKAEPAAPPLAATMCEADLNNAASALLALDARTLNQEPPTPQLQSTLRSDDEFGDPGTGWQLCEDGGYIPSADSQVPGVDNAIDKACFSLNQTPLEKLGFMGTESLASEASCSRSDMISRCSTMAMESLRHGAEASRGQTSAASIEAHVSARGQILQQQSGALCNSPSSRKVLCELSQHLAEYCHSIPSARGKRHHLVLSVGGISISAVSANSVHSKDSVNAEMLRGTLFSEFDTRAPQTPRSTERSAPGCSFLEVLRKKGNPGSNEEEARSAMAHAIIARAAAVRTAKQPREQGAWQLDCSSVHLAADQEVTGSWTEFEQAREERAAAIRWIAKYHQAEQVAARMSPASEWHMFDRAAEEKVEQDRRAAREMETRRVVEAEQAAASREAAVALAVEERGLAIAAAAERTPCIGRPNWQEWLALQNRL